MCTVDGHYDMTEYLPIESFSFDVVLPIDRQSGRYNIIPFSFFVCACCGPVTMECGLGWHFIACRGDGPAWLGLGMIGERLRLLLGGDAKLVNVRHE